MEKKKIAVIASSIAINGEKGLNRVGSVAKIFSENGYETELITSRFQHWFKRNRTQEEIDAINENFKVTFIDEPGYTKNVDLKRIFSHNKLAKNIYNYLNTQQYDVVYCVIPDNHLSALVGKYANEKGIPYVVDVEDLWPEAMRMVLDIPVVSDVLFSYFSKDAKKTYRSASAVVGSSDGYRDEPLKYNVTFDKKETVYVGNDMSVFDKGVEELADTIEKKDGEFWFAYAGSLGTSYDIPTLIKAAQKIYSEGKTDIRVKILGDGVKREEFEAVAKEAPCNVDFLGYCKFPFMAACLSKCDVTVNSLVMKAPQAFVSKIGDYLAAGKPMISTCMDKEFWAKVENDGFGVNVQPEDVDALYEKMMYLYNNPEVCAQMGKIARTIGEQQFDRRTSYLKLVKLTDELLGE